MSYRARITWAVTLSLILHAALIPILGRTRSNALSAPIAPRSEPIVLALTPPQDRPLKRLIEGGAPAEAPPQPTDLISNRDTQAQDLSEKSGATQPDADSPSEFDELAAPEIQPVPSPPQPPAVEQPEIKPQEPASEPAEELAPPQPEETTPADMPVLDAIEPTGPEPAVARRTPDQKTPQTQSRREDRTPKLAEEKPAAEPLPERFDVAKADPPLPPQTAELGIVRGREGGGADRKGELSFEATKHAMADYMLAVRRKVERTWRSALQFRFSGTSKVAAVLECTISPDGRVVDVTILDRGDSFVYASLCKQAIERAAPFDPFPFDVPDEMRQENLVIRWKFTYM
jgi:hypothetical protein